MDDENLIGAITTAFKDVTWPSDAGAEPRLGLVESRNILRHIFRFSDDVRKFYVPHLLRFSLVDDLDAASRKEWIRMLVTLLNVDRGARTPGIDRLLEQAQERAYLSYTEQQSKAILAWLEWVASNHNNPLFEDELRSAIQYWRDKARSARQ